MSPISPFVSVTKLYFSDTRGTTNRVTLFDFTVVAISLSFSCD
jgi:hypothetical protein